MISLGSIVIELLANTASFQQGMTKASFEGRKAAKEIHTAFSETASKLGNASQAALSSLGEFGAVAGELSRNFSEALSGIGASTSGIAVAVAGLGALGVAAIAAGAGLLEMAKGGAEVVEKLAHISEKTGISIRDLQIFEAAGKTVGVSLDDMVIGMRRFDQALTGFGKGAAAQGILRELGITAKNNKEALLQTADAFKNMEDPVRRNTAAVALFGKSGLSMIPILLKGRDGILEWEKAVDALGPKISKDAVAANEAYRKSVEEMSLSWDRFKVKSEEALTPALAKATSWFAKLNFESLLAGGMGVGDVFKDQTAARQAATEEVKKQAAAQDELRRNGEQIQASLQERFELLKAGGSAAYALEKKRQELTDDVQNGLFKEASAIQSQLPGLEKAAALESQRVAHAKQLAASYASLQESFAKGGASPLLKIAPSNPTKGIEALFGPQPTKNPLEGAPDVGEPDFLKNAPDLMKQTFGTGLQEVRDFEAQWKATSASINTDYDKQLEHWKDLLNKQAISQTQFNDISRKLETDRLQGLKQLRQDNGTSTFRDSWQDMFKDLENSGKDFARSISLDIGAAIQSLNQQLAQFAVTGKGLSLKSIGQSLEMNLVGSVLRKAESGLAGAFGGLFGLNTAKADGSTASKALFVQMAGAGAFGASGLDNLPLGGLANLFGGATTKGTTTPGSSSGGFLSGIGGFLGSIAKIFGSFLAGGGDAQPGKAFIVGEKRPELFIPRSAGTVVPYVPNGDSSKHLHVTNELHVHGVTDADSFKRSQNQIMNTMTRAQQRAASR